MPEGRKILAHVQAAIVEVFDEEARRLRRLDESLTWDASGALPTTGGVSAWLTVSHRGAEDPHLELTAKVVVGRHGLLLLSSDIGTFEGDVVAELERDDGGMNSPAAVAGELRRFLAGDAALIERMAMK